MKEPDLIGVAIPRCYFCGKDKNQLIMNAKFNPILANKVNKVHGCVIDKEPCDECKKYMDMGIILISTKDNDQEYRTGGFVVVKEEAVEKMPIPDDIKEHALKARALFLADSVWTAFGLPRA